jgi:hypothetical protein
LDYSSPDAYVLGTFPCSFEADHKPDRLYGLTIGQIGTTGLALVYQAFTVTI